MNYCDLTEEMKKEPRFVVWALYDDSPMAMHPKTLNLYRDPRDADWMEYDVAKKNMLRIRKKGTFEVNLGYVDEGGNLLLIDE